MCYVTGASRGLGESIAVNIANRLPAGSVLVLLARNEEKLGKVKNRLLLESPVLAVTQHYDQGTQDQSIFENILLDTLKSSGSNVEDFEQAILVNNAGTIAPMNYIRNLPKVEELSNHFHINVSGAAALTTQFLRTFPAESGICRVVVNISSLGAIQPFKSWSMYCAGEKLLESTSVCSARH